MQRRAGPVMQVAVLIVAVLSLHAWGAGSAVGGGWAVVTLDPIGAGPQPGKAFPVSFVIRQHGVTPAEASVLSGNPVGIVVTRGSVRSVVTATPLGSASPGRWKATLRFPSAGTWAWSVTPGWFPAQDLGTVEVGRVGAKAPFADGRTLVLWKGCAGCHETADYQSRFSAGPSLRGLDKVAGSRIAGYDAAAYVRESLVKPSAYQDPVWKTSGTGAGMPTLNLTNAEVDAILRYLLKPR